MCIVFVYLELVFLFQVDCLIYRRASKRLHFDTLSKESIPTDKSCQHHCCLHKLKKFLPKIPFMLPKEVRLLLRTPALGRSVRQLSVHTWAELKFNYDYLSLLRLLRTRLTLLGKGLTFSKYRSAVLCVFSFFFFDIRVYSDSTLSHRGPRH